MNKKDIIKKALQDNHLDKENILNKILYEDEIPQTNLISPKQKRSRFVYSCISIIVGLTLGIITSYILITDIFLDDSKPTEPIKPIDYNNETIQIMVLGIEENNNKAVIEHSFIKDEQNLVLKIITGTPGVQINADKLTAIIKNSGEAFELSDTVLDEVADITYPKPLDVDFIFEKYYIPAVNARYENNNGTIVIVEDEPGEQLSLEELNLVKKVIDSKNTEEFYCVNIICFDPEIKTSDLTAPEFTDNIGTASTSFATSEFVRKHNLKLAAELINGYILLPGEIFSFNNIVGEPTIPEGYSQSPIFENQKNPFESGMFGFCHVSTTLYNALLYGGFEIIERYPISQRVTYVISGMDAAVVYDDEKDLKFKNNFDVPVKIVSTVSTAESTITIEIKGINKNKDIKYSFSSEKTNSFTQSGKNYEEYTVYRTVTKNNIIIEDKKEFYKNIYLVFLK